MDRPDIPVHYFSPDREERISFRIIPLEYKTEYDHSIPHRHNYYEIFVFSEGGGQHDIDFETLPIGDLCLQFVSPGQVHKVRRALKSCGHVILFSRDFFLLGPDGKEQLFELPFLHGLTPNPEVKVTPGDWPVFRHLLQSMEAEYERSPQHNMAILRSYLNILLLESARRFQHGPAHIESPHHHLLRRFRIALEKEFRQMHQVREYASLLAVTEKTLNELTKREMGATALEVIHDRIVLEARRLLFHSNLSNKEIAHFLHFEDPSHFSKFFKRRMGQSPSAYRQYIQSNYGQKP